MNRLRRIARQERGVMAVTVALMLPAFLTVGVLAVDVGNWYVHKRQLQIQADAGALAGGGVFQFPCSSTTSAAIRGEAGHYAGLIQSVDHNWVKTIPQDRHKVLLNDDPCADRAIDVKSVEENAPGLFGAFSLPTITAHARVELKTATSVPSLLPVAVPEPTPQNVFAQLIDESSGSLLKEVALSQVGGTTNPILWDNAASPVTLDLDRDKIGVRVVLSKSASSDCSADGVACYDSSSSSGTLTSLRRWPAGFETATQPEPYVSELRLGPGTCGTPYFAPVPVNQSPCSMGVFVTAHVNGTVTKTTPDTVTGTVNGAPLTFAYVAGDEWRATGAVSLASYDGSKPLELKVSQRDGKVHGTACTKNKPCDVTISDAQRTYGASSLTSGPIQSVEVDEVTASGTQSYANSFPRCSSAPCNKRLVIRVGVGSLHVAKAGEAPTVLRVADSQANQSLDCGGAGNLADQLANGCDKAFRIAEPGECDLVGHYTDLDPNPPNPWPCVEVKPGVVANAVDKAMKQRIMGGQNSCSPSQANHWADYPNFPEGDQRIVPLFLTEFGAPYKNGKTTVPITGFAFFYITGWTGQGNQSQTGCGNDAAPDDKGGFLVGHFIKRTVPPTAAATDEDCQDNELSPCTAVLTE